MRNRAARPSAVRAGDGGALGQAAEGAGDLAVAGVVDDGERRAAGRGAGRDRHPQLGLVEQDTAGHPQAVGLVLRRTGTQAAAVLGLALRRAGTRVSAVLWGDVDVEDRAAAQREA